MPQKFDDTKQKKQLATLRHREEEALVQELADNASMAYIDLSGVGINTDALKLIPEEESRVLGMAGFKLTGKNLWVAIRSPHDNNINAKLDELRAMEYVVTPFMVSRASLEKAWDRYQDITYATESSSFLNVSGNMLEKIASEVKTNDDVKKTIQKILEAKESHTISKVLEVILGSAIATDSSDVHIEVQEKNVRLRFRQDGVLNDIMTFKHEVEKFLNSRIKLLSNLKLTIKDDSQDGRFTIHYHDTQIEVRTSIVPGSYGEGIVMRILNPKTIAAEFDTLGIEPKLLKILEDEIQKPNGMILTTGPTGSGKTTTLYAFLRKVYTPEIKIMTIEDPIEYHLKGITQTQVDHDKGYGFLQGLRGALRQDPDVIMVGEIRDKETATIAVNSALTGHLVLSTLHTNNAAGAIPRLIDLGVNPRILGSALTVSIAQRLVRKLCEKCKKERKPKPAEEKLLQGILTHAHEAGKDLEAYDLTPDQEIKLHDAVGCEECNGVGYKGRTGVFEAILTDEAIERVMNENPSERMINKTAEAQKIFTMQEDGVVKILAGITSLEEVVKVVDLSSEKKNENLNGNVNLEKDLEKVTSNSNSHSHSNSPSELALLVDYLKRLESDQATNPTEGIADKIATARDMILTRLKNTPEDQLFPKQPNGIHARRDIEQLIADLDTLEAHQQKNPDVGITDKIQNIRQTIEGMM